MKVVFILWIGHTETAVQLHRYFDDWQFGPLNGLRLGTVYDSVTDSRVSLTAVLQKDSDVGDVTTNTTYYWLESEPSWLGYKQQLIDAGWTTDPLPDWLND